ncbi:hypothetical protein J437_LFUL007291 [Ladona fulva]|uniref:ABC transmembrane type-2 domain-containing protein n=1 Tax=Ladona fulva TaxID=123851 RepID=A0A8K0K1L7_LADFU|nr:hypothetical protein J437_LFUL007291 [Ladona fulva]
MSTGVRGISGEKPVKRTRSAFGEWKALHFKNAIRFARNPGVLGFVFGFPIFQIVLYFAAIGGDPTDLSIAVVNQEARYSGQNDCTEYTKGFCNDSTLSCRYLEILKASKYMEVKYAGKNLLLLHPKVRRGRAWGAVIIPENFTKALNERIDRGIEADEELIDNGDVQVYLDMSDQQLSTLIRRRLYADLHDLLNEIYTNCGLNPKIGTAAIKFNDPVFGVKEPTFQSFTIPAVIITTVFFLAVGLTATLLVTERTEGMWDRTMVMGITPWQLLESHLEWQVLLICGQVFEVAILMLFVYQVELKGSVLLLLIHMFLQGMSGMSFGFLVSICSKHVSEANYMATGSFIPMIVTSGAMWPLEGMPRFFRYFAYCFPSTMATESLRSIMFRGWGIEMETVYLGFVTTLAWIIFFAITCRILLVYKKL